MKTLSLQGINTLLKIHIYSKTMNKKMKCTWTIIRIYYKKIAKKIQKFICMKKLFWGKVIIL
jgi:hypothetical protein